MKTITKKILIAILSLMIFSSSVLSISATTSEETKFALIADNCVLYKLTDGEFTPITSLPSTYFVALLNATVEEYSLVSYMDIEGYVKADTITVVDYEPVTKYASPTISPYNDDNPINIRSQADNSQSNIISKIPANDFSAIYYGNVEGSTILEAVGNKWYYIRYTTGSENFYGYVYSGHIKATPLADNIIEKVTKPIPPPIENPIADAAPFKPLDILIIIALVIPSIAIIFVIFRKSTPARRPRHYDN